MKDRNQNVQPLWFIHLDHDAQNHGTKSKIQWHRYVIVKRFSYLKMIEEKKKVLEFFSKCIVKESICLSVCVDDIKITDYKNNNEIYVGFFQTSRSRGNI